MTKKDFVQFAKMIRTQRHRIIHTNNTITNGNCDAELQEQLDTLVNELCDIFASDNSQFNRAKFIQACEIDTASK